MPVVLEKRGAGGAQVTVCWNSCGGIGRNARFTMVSRGVSQVSQVFYRVQHKDTKIWYNLSCLTEMKHNVTCLDSSASGN